MTTSEPRTPAKTRLLSGHASSPHSTTFIQSSCYNTPHSSRSTTPDSVFSEATHRSITPRTHATPSKTASTHPFPLDTPRARKTRKQRVKPTYQQGITVYPLTFPHHQDIYTYAPDPHDMSTMLDREHFRVSALPPGLLGSLNTVPHDESQPHRVGYLTSQWARSLRTGQKNTDFPGFTDDQIDVYAFDLHAYTSKYREKMERDARYPKERRRPLLHAQAAPGRVFTPAEHETYQKIIAWKGTPPLHMGQYESWLEEWTDAKEHARQGRTALGNRKPAPARTAGQTSMHPKNGKSTRKRGRGGELEIDVVLAEACATRTGTGTVAVQDDEALADGTDARAIKKRRMAAGVLDSTVGDVSGDASEYFANRGGNQLQAHVLPASRATAPLIPQKVNQTAPKPASTKHPRIPSSRRLGFTVSKSSITSSCSSPDAGPEKPVRPLTPRGRDLVMPTIIRQAVDDELLALAEPEREVSPTPATFVTARSTAAPVAASATVGSPVAVVAEAVVAAAVTFDADYWEALSRKRVAKVERARLAALRRRDRRSDDESQEALSAALTGEGGLAEEEMNVEKDREMDEEKGDDGIAGPGNRETTHGELTLRSGQKFGFPSLSFPQDLPTSTPKQESAKLAATGDAMSLNETHDHSPDHPGWACESLPSVPAAPPITTALDELDPEMTGTQSSDFQERHPEKGSLRMESMSDLTGLMDDLTRAAAYPQPPQQSRQSGATSKPARPAWDMASSPPEGSANLGPSQRIRRMGDGVMAMASDLLGQDLYE